ncbi:hypothetical protein [Mesorhizobium sp. 43Arga]
MPDQRGGGNAHGGQKKAGRENGPAKKKVITFRGEHRLAKWEENTKRIFLF